MKEYTSKLHQQLLDAFEAYDKPGVMPVKRLRGKLNIVQQELDELKKHFFGNPPVSVSDEIDFFKYEKPLIVSERILAFEKFTIESSGLIDHTGTAGNFYEQELRTVKRFFRQYQFMYQYYILDASDLDHLLFVRNAEPSGLFLPEISGESSDFSTAADYLFARFMAYERLQDYLMDCLYGKTGKLESFRSSKGRVLQWTGDKTNLVELAYAIYGTMQINDGEADISDIAEWLEQSLNVSLGRYYRTFAEIKMRKIISPTRYIDDMQQTLRRQIEEGDL